MNLTISQEMTVDSVTVAEHCGVTHEAALKLLKSHGAKLEAAFGRVRFEIATFPTKGGTQKRRIAHLTEDQATAFITLFQNTEKVVDFKFALVAAFSEAKRRLGENDLTRDAIREYVIRDYYRRTAPAHDFGSVAKDGRVRVGFRAPTFTVSPGRMDDAVMVAADRIQLDDSQLMLELEAAK